MATIYPPTPHNMERAARIIREGGIVSFPTETVYGLGADVFNAEGVIKIFEAKKRPFFDPLIAHIADIEQIEKLCADIPGRAMDIAAKFWPGPLTIVVPRSSSVPDIATSGLSTVAVRMPDHPVALELIRLSGTSIAAPSANPFGYLSPTRAGHVLKGLGDSIDMIIDGGPCTVGVESTIIKIEDSRTILLRPGGISLEQLEPVTGPVITGENLSDITEAPGQLPYHYSPSKIVRIFESAEAMDFSSEDTAFLLFRECDRNIIEPADPANIEILSPSGDLREAAANIFSALHRLDSLPVSRIHAEAIPETGLGRAIMDRLKKASKKQGGH